MGKTKIEWVKNPDGTQGETWNPIVGCSKVSDGCRECYAISMAHRLASNPKTPQYAGTTKITNGRPNWSGKMGLVEHKLREPMGWRKPRLVFVNSMGDLFHDSVPDEWIDKIFAVMAMCPHHTFQILTKRSERMKSWFYDLDVKRRIDRGLLQLADDSAFVNKALFKSNAKWPSKNWPLPNVWLGVSIESADVRNSRLADLCAIKRYAGDCTLFASIEPMLSDVPLQGRHDGRQLNWLGDGGLDWVIVGGESGPGARSMDEDWIRSIRDQCAAANVPFFYKQKVVDGRKVALPVLDGQVHDAMPQNMKT